MQLIRNKMLRPDSGNPMRRPKSGLRLSVVVFSLASLTLSGCATTTYTSEEAPTVTQSIAKRDLGMGLFVLLPNCDGDSAA